MLYLPSMKSVIIISAMSHGRVIGTQDGMPWNVPEEYQQYLNFVDGQTVIMGRKSYEIFGKDLHDTHNLVISRNYPNGIGYGVVHSLEEAIARAKTMDRTIFIAGGSSIYEQALPLADEMYLSYIQGKYEGIAFFPAFDVSDWTVIERRAHPKFDFVHYKRKNASS